MSETRPPGERPDAQSSDVQLLLRQSSLDAASGAVAVPPPPRAPPNPPGGGHQQLLPSGALPSGEAVSGITPAALELLAATGCSVLAAQRPTSAIPGRSLPISANLAPGARGAA